MHQYPMHAYEMLSSIPFLPPALDNLIVTTKNGMVWAIRAVLREKRLPLQPEYLPELMFGMRSVQIDRILMHGRMRKRANTFESNEMHFDLKVVVAFFELLEMIDN
jgi:hypothetical protein